MKSMNDPIKEAILEAVLPAIPFDGWTMETLETAAISCGYAKDMVSAVFPDGVKDAIIFFSSWADQKMLMRLDDQSIPPRVRDKITFAVRSRFEELSPYKEAERLAIAYWMRPMRKYHGAKLVWKTADVIWDYAGDTATDYNRYTKRLLLSGVLTATAFYWLNDKSDEHKETWAFLDRRIENVMGLGKMINKLKTA